MGALIEVFIIATSLAMDALSVSIAGGIKSREIKVVDAAKVAFAFGIFQAFMPVLGWLVGSLLQSFVSVYSPWIAFVLLSLIGINMIKESFSQEEGVQKKNILQWRTLSLLAIATSIDALIVGITLHVLAIPFWIAIVIIGVVTFVLCFLGYLFGNVLGKFFGKRFEVIGGIALIAIGLKIFIEHLYL